MPARHVHSEESLGINGHDAVFAWTFFAKESVDFFTERGQELTHFTGHILACTDGRGWQRRADTWRVWHRMFGNLLAPD